MSPTSGVGGQTISNFTITGENLAGVTAIEFTPSAGITVVNLRASETSVTAVVAIAAAATGGSRSVAVVSPAGRSSTLVFEVFGLPANLTPGVPASFTLPVVAAPALFGNWLVNAPQGATQFRVEVELTTPGVRLDLYVSRVDPVTLRSSSLGAGLFEVSYRFGWRPHPKSYDRLR